MECRKPGNPGGKRGTHNPPPATKTWHMDTNGPTDSAGPSAPGGERPREENPTG